MALFIDRIEACVTYDVQAEVLVLIQMTISSDIIVSFYKITGIIDLGENITRQKITCGKGKLTFGNIKGLLEQMKTLKDIGK